MIAAAIWLAVLTGPAVWVSGILRLAGTGRLLRFLLAYPLWAAASLAAMFPLSWMWFGWSPPATSYGGPIIFMFVWLFLVGPVAALGMALYLKAERRRG